MKKNNIVVLRRRIFSGVKVNVTPASDSNAVGCCNRANAIIDFFAVYTATVTYSGGGVA